MDPPPQISDTSALELRRLTAEFEERWRRGEPPNLHEFAAVWNGTEREVLLKELLLLEVALRREKGEQPRIGEYSGEFPELAEFLVWVFASAMLPAASSGGVFLSSFGPVGDSAHGRTDTRVSDSLNAAMRHRALSAAVPPPQIAGYEILQEVGRGGMGIVYKARDLRLKRIVALKMILAGAHAQLDEVARFLMEAESIARLQHPNIVQIYEVGLHEERPFFALEFVDGVSLDRHAGGKPLAPRVAAELVLAMARAMHSAHTQGIVHRDLKPANVLLAQGAASTIVSASQPGRDGTAQPLAPDPTRVEAPHSKGAQATAFASARLLTAHGGLIPKITDFGLAMRLDDDSRQTTTGTILGTPQYMAPEQAAGRIREIGPPADTYALGAILYELLTGRPPFHGATPVDTLLMVRQREPVRPGQLQPGLSPDLETVCLKCLEKDVSRRYATAAELADELHRYLRDEPIQARPISRGERAWRWCRRNPVVAGLMATVLVSLLAGTAGSLYFAVQAGKRADDAGRSEKAERSARNVADVARNQAVLAREAAEKARIAAESAREDARRKLVRLNIATGDRQLDAGEPWSTVLWYHKAWELDRSDPAQEASHRLRLASTLQRLPKIDGLCVHADRLVDAAFDPAGKRVLTRDPQQAFVWDPSAGRVLFGPLQHSGRVVHASWSRDGKRTLTAGADGTATLWDAETGKAQRTYPHGAEVFCAALSHDGRQLATAGSDQRLKIWPTDDEHASPRNPNIGADVWALAFSPDGTRLLTANQYSKARLWDVANGKFVAEPWSHTARYEPRIDFRQPPLFSPDGKLQAGISGRLVELRETQTGKLVRTLEFGAPAYLAFSSDGTRLLYPASSDAHIVEIATGKSGAMIRHPRQCWRGCFSPDGRLAATTSSGGIIHVWDTNSGAPVIAPFRHVEGINRLEFHPDGKHLLAAGLDGTARVWRVVFEPFVIEPHDLACGRADLIRGGSGGGRFAIVGDSHIAYSADGRREIRFGNSAQAQIVERTTETPTVPPLEHGEPVAFAVFSPDGRRALTAGAAILRVWDAETGKPFGPAIPIEGVLNQAWLSDDGTRLLATFNGTSAQVWEMETGRSLLGPLTQTPSAMDEPPRLYRCGISPDGNRIAVVGTSLWGLRVFDVGTGKGLDAARNSPGIVWSAEFSGDGRRVISGSSDTTARLWDLDPLRLAGPILRHPTFVRDAGVDFDGRRVVTIDATGSVRVWDGATGDLLVPPFNFPERPARVWFSRDGRRVIGLTGEGKTWQWRLPAFELSREDAALTVRLLVGRRIDEADGIDSLPVTEFRDQPERYQSTWQAGR